MDGRLKGNPAKQRGGQCAESHQIGLCRAINTVAHEGKDLVLDVLMDRQPVKEVQNESGYMCKPRDATYKMEGGATLRTD